MPGTPPTSPRFGAPRYSDTVDTASFGSQVNGVTDAFDAGVAGWSSGTYASLPAAGSSNVGKFYYATDINALFHSDGTKWRTVYGSRGSAIISAAQSTGSGPYTLLGTPDEVQNILLPSDGLIKVLYMATWQESVQGSGLAGLYIDATPVARTELPSPVYDATNLFSGANPPANTNALLFSNFNGTNTEAGGTGYAGSVTTGQAMPGGPLHVFAAAGTYTVSVKFAVQSGGTVTASNRRLYVEAVPFD
jgi:hypothetical protein